MCGLTAQPRPTRAPPPRFFNRHRQRARLAANVRPLLQTRMTDRTPRALSDTEFLERFKSVVHRLDSHIAAIDDGDYFIRDDLATVLRTLLTRGKGDDGIRRLLSRFGLSAPTRRISPSANEVANVLLAIGALPAEEDPSSVVAVPDGLMSAVALFVRSDKGARRATWEDVVTDYGNTFGAHLSTTVPVLLDDVHYFGLSETDFGTYMLRSAGVLTSSACHELLQQLKADDKLVTHSPYMDGAQITQAIYLREAGKDDLRVQVRREKWKRAGPIMSVRNAERRDLLFSVAEGGYLQLEVRVDGAKVGA